MTHCRVLLADGDPLARRSIATMITKLDGFELVAQARDSDEAVRFAGEFGPDVAVLDTDLPGRGGFSAAAAMIPSPATIFVSAHATHALKAFEVGAGDFVQKPVRVQRMQAALLRVRKMLQRAEAKEMIAELNEALAALRPAIPAEEKSYPSDIWISDGGERVRLRLDAIEAVLAEGEDATFIYSNGERRVRRSMRWIEEVLDPHAFVRLQRSLIVRRNQIAGISQDDVGPLKVTLADGSEIVVGRIYRERVRNLTLTS